MTLQVGMGHYFWALATLGRLRCPFAAGVGACAIGDRQIGQACSATCPCQRHAPKEVAAQFRRDLIDTTAVVVSLITSNVLAMDPLCKGTL